MLRNPSLTQFDTGLYVGMCAFNMYDSCGAALSMMKIGRGGNRSNKDNTRFVNKIPLIVHNDVLRHAGRGFSQVQGAKLQITYQCLK